MVFLIDKYFDSFAEIKKNQIRNDFRFHSKEKKHIIKIKKKKLNHFIIKRKNINFIWFELLFLFQQNLNAEKF